MVYDAVILAGGRICEELRAAAAYDNEAFIMIAGQPMILYVYKALRQCPSIRKIVISGPIRMEYWKAAGTVESLRNILDQVLSKKYY
jgi:2-C-methyl-D-erythritol 4-phosphate cytidylyltransferase